MDVGESELRLANLASVIAPFVCATSAMNSTAALKVIDDAMYCVDVVLGLSWFGAPMA